LKRKTKYLLWFLALVLVMACVPTLSATPAVPPTLDPGGINQIIAQTANAASTRTALALPTSTSTRTPIPTPRGTHTTTPTPTETIVFVYNTPTTFVLPSVTATFKPTSNKDYACEIIDSPKNREFYDPRVQFNVKWRVRNVGRQAWDRNAIDITYVSGDKFHLVEGYDLKRTTFIGEIADLIMEMKAPKDPGTYTTFWAMLDPGGKEFCKLKLTIIVVDKNS